MRRASLLAALVCAGTALAALAQDAARGRELYDAHCGGCHYPRVHQREPERRLVKSLAELRVEVARRAAQTTQPFAVEDLEDIAAHLNRSYYRFDP